MTTTHSDIDDAKCKCNADHCGKCALLSSGTKVECNVQVYITYDINDDKDNLDCMDI